METTKEVVKVLKTEITVDHVIPVEILDDLSSRFIINVPQEEKKELIRVCFQIELAHWFYLDFYCNGENSKLKPCGMKEFTTHIFQHIPTLRPFSKDVDGILTQWREYKMAVPTFGAIILNKEMTHVLLVQSFWARTSWGFPKGKVNKEEDPIKCAVREVLEETGFDISKLIDPNEYIESNVNDQIIRLYIISGITMETKFQPLTRNEIKAVEWFLLSDLPTTKKDMTPKLKIGVGPNSFFMVVPFVKRLRKWVFEKQLKNAGQGQAGGQQLPKRYRHKSMGDVDSSNANNGSPGGGGGNFGGRKQHQQFSHSLQLEIQELQLKRASAASSPPRNNGRSRHGDKERKQSFKRKLVFSNQTGDAVSETSQEQQPPQLQQLQKGRSKTPQSSLSFCATSWLNFKFNRDEILRAFTGAN